MILNDRFLIHYENSCEIPIFITFQHNTKEFISSVSPTVSASVHIRLPHSNSRKYAFINK